MADTHKRVNPSIEIDGKVDDKKLDIKISIEFEPLNFMDNYDEQDIMSKTDKVNLCENIMWNYIPYGLCKSEKTGRYTSFDSAIFDTYDTEWKHESTYEISEYCEERDIYETDLKDSAISVFSIDESESAKWFLGEGKQFNFDYAINGNAYFSIYTTEEGFKDLMKEVREDETGEIRKLYLNWIKPDGVEKNTVTISTSIDISSFTEEYTFAVVLVNPSDKQIHTKFLYVGPSDIVEPEKKIKILDGTVTYTDDENRTELEKETSGDGMIKVKINTKDTTEKWKSLRPKIDFDVEIYYE